MLTMELLLLSLAFHDVITAVDNVTIIVTNSSSSLIPVNETFYNSTEITRFNFSLADLNILI